MTVEYDDWGEKPVPQVDPESRAYWEFASEGVLAVQRCGDCGEAQFYPRELCRHCWSRDLAMEPTDGRGTLYTYTVCHVPGQPGYDAETPYAVALVELDVDPNPSGRPVRLTTHVDEPAADLELGMALEAGFRQVAEDPEIHLPVFERAEGDGG